MLLRLKRICLPSSLLLSQKLVLVVCHNSRQPLCAGDHVDLAMVWCRAAVAWLILSIYLDTCLCCTFGLAETYLLGYLSVLRIWLGGDLCTWIVVCVAHLAWCSSSGALPGYCLLRHLLLCLLELSESSRAHLQMNRTKIHTPPHHSSLCSV